MNSLKSYERDNEDIAMLPYSSGTTGLSKGVQLTHKNIVYNCIMKNYTRLTTPAIGDHQDVLPCVLPFFHIYGFTCSLISKLANGCKLVTLPKFTPDTYLNAVEKYEGTLLHLVPPISEGKVTFITLNEF